MAKLEGNVFGGFRGKLGNLVGYSWKGRWCVRALPARVHNPRTEAQQRHRGMFAEEVRLAGRMSWALNIGLAAVAEEQQMTPQNVFVRLNQGAFAPADISLAGTEQNAGNQSCGSVLAVEWSTLALSAGPVAPVALGVPTVSDEGVLSVDFEKNPYRLRANNYDQVHLYVYCPALNMGYLAAPVYRKERRICVALPDGMAAQVLHVYAFVTDRDGRASETAYGGTLQVNGALTAMTLPNPTADDASWPYTNVETDSQHSQPCPTTNYGHARDATGIPAPSPEVQPV